jgi:uncharacterized protein YfaP (DUF2135 family)
MMIHLTLTSIITATAHIYYANPGDTSVYPYAALDYDVTTGYGPETITISEMAAEDYILYVYNYSQSPSITESNATLQAYSHGQPLFNLNVPTTGSGEYWYVCDFRRWQMILIT